MLVQLLVVVIIVGDFPDGIYCCCTFTTYTRFTLGNSFGNYIALENALYWKLHCISHCIALGIVL